MSSNKKILVRLPNWLGDLVMSFAFIDSLKSVYPGSEISVIVKKELYNALNYCDSIDNIYEFSKSDYPGFSGIYKFGKIVSEKNKFDFYFCLPDSFSSALMGYFSGSKIRAGYKNWPRNFLLTHSYKRNKNLHRLELYLDLLKKFSERSVEVSLKIINTTKPESLLPPGKNLLLNINSEAQSRRMPFEFAKRLVSEIINKYDFNIIFSGSKKDIVYVSKLEYEFKSHKNIFNFAGKTNLKQLFNLINEVDFVISTDSGLAHIANAYLKKTVVLFGAGDESKTKPFNDQNLKIIRKEGLKCAPCVSNTCIFGQPLCLAEMDINFILDELDKLIFQTEDKIN